MKHLKVKCELPDSNSKNALLTILEQTSYGKDFACMLVLDCLNQAVFVHNGVAITSCGYPTVTVEHATCDLMQRSAKEFVDCVLYVGGTITKLGSATIPVELWPRIREAIVMYNRYFA